MNQLQGRQYLGRAADMTGQVDVAKDRCAYAVPTAPEREPTMSESILQQTHVLHKMLADIEARAEQIVGKLGYPVDDCSKSEARPSRGGALGNIADQLDATEAPLRRISGHLEIISRQI